MQFAIYEGHMEDLEKKLNRIIKKCQKYGNPFTYNKVGEEIRHMEYTDEETGEKTEGNFKFIIIEVEGTASIADWTAVAVLEIHKEGNLIRRINTDVEIPERFSTSQNICEHCGTRRHRKNLYVIHNEQTNEWKQVGGDCLKLYTGGLSLEYVASFLDGLVWLEEFDGFLGGHVRPVYNVQHVLSVASTIIDKMGYFSSSSRTVTTKDFVATMFGIGHINRNCLEQLNNEIKRKDIKNISFKESDFDKAHDEKADAIIDYYMGQEANSEFIRNVQILLKEGYVSYKNFGFLCYLPEGYNKYMQIQKERAERDLRFLKERNASQYFGTVGQRVKNMAISMDDIKYVSSFGNAYGVTTLYKMYSPEGNVIMWYASNTLEGMFRNQLEKDYDLWNTSRYGLDEEDIMKMYDIKSVTFTIKEHKEYKGTQQTIITRPTFKLVLNRQFVDEYITEKTNESKQKLAEGKMSERTYEARIERLQELSEILK